MKLNPHDTLLLIGDSITDTGRARPVGEGLSGALGTGYVSLVDAILNTWQPEIGVRVINMGTSGHTVRDLAGRWQSDVLNLRPDWVSVMIGTNDVWRQFDSPNSPEGHVLPAEYARTLNALVTRTLPAVKGMVLLTPFYLEPRSDAMRARMDDYGAMVRQTAEAHGTLFVDTQAAFDAVLAHVDPAALAGDRIHPSVTGHMVLARALLNALDFPWSVPGN